ncbi:prepilin-type N-terminal cleavage/methylation domain-containing protein [uncultured Gemmiger sp.]|uniref:type IV pilus modification PilV family protein n=1 Tax=uncultured Gemmiger sp. TaxID=1623490 RepID=UPI0025E73453|nr:prepilin-type N-terminal cleavage/methylation domain-containing protein [uncultured Gemmiger sp.]
MKKLRQALQNQRGETIVEVLVSFVLLMLFLALFTVSLRFARRASVQAQTTRDNAYTLTGKLYPASNEAVEWEPGDKSDLNFGSFTVKNVQLQTKPADVKDENGNIIASHTFTRYYKEDTTP